MSPCFTFFFLNIDSFKNLTILALNLKIKYLIFQQYNKTSSQELNWNLIERTILVINKVSHFKFLKLKI